MMSPPCMPSLKYRLALMSAVILAVAVLAGLLAIVSSPSIAAAQTGAPATSNIRVVDGPNPGEVVISWDAVPAATHYRIGYVNMIQDYPLAKASVTGEWIEAFVYVDVNARNFTVSGGRVEYTVRRLAQGDRHAFTVLTSSDFKDTGSGGSVSSEFSWASDRWEFHVVADRGGACPAVGAAAASADVSGATSQGAGTTAADTSEGGATGHSDPGPPPDVPFERRHITLGIPAIGAPYWETGNGRFAGQMEDARVAAQTSAPATSNIRVVDGPNPGEVVISWDAVPAATHYRIGYVNMIQDYPLAKASVTGEWIEAFVYVDVNARNFTVSGGRVEYTVRRLAQGDRHAFTVLTSSDFKDTGSGGSVSSEFSWASDRWEFHVVADRGGACPTTGVPIVTPPVVVTSLAGLEHGAWLEQNRPQAAADIRALTWVGDGINGSELQAAEALIATARWYPSVFSSLMQMSWLGDDVTDAEAISIVYVRYTAFFDSKSTGADLARQMLAKSWVQDAISADEATVIRYLYWTISYDTDSPPLPSVIAVVNVTVSRILAMPFLASVEGPDALAVRSLERIEDISKTDFLRVMAHPTLNDGITDEEAEIVLLFGATYQYAGRTLVNTLLDPTSITVEKRAIRLPQSGEVDLAIVRTAPGPARSMDLLEHSVRGIEEFMGTSFPTNYIAALFAEEAVREGAAGVNFGTHMAMLPEFDVDDGSQLANILPSLTTHEVAHYYWRGNETWIDEGGATFMEFPVENTRTGRGLIADRYPCAYVSSIAEVVALDPESLSPADICNYSLGERIFLDLYRNLGDAAYRRGFSSLYQRSQVLDERLWPTELNISHVRDAFQPLASAATDVITRWYDGPRPQGIAPSDTGSVNPELATIAGGQVINAFVSLEDDWDAFGDWESFIARGTESFSVADAAGKYVFVYLGLTVPVTVDPKILPLEVIEHYEDGFLYDDYVARLEFEPEWNRGWWRLRIGPRKDDPWLPGRYWVFLYDGERKVAEVTYEVTP